MKPLFFSEASRQLYGVYQPPATSVRGAQAVLLCYPGIHEYNAAHWAFRRLAAALSRQGHHVLRFDYFGTGDSAGSEVETYPETWVSNVKEAARELLDLSGLRAVSLVGLRLGAAVALSACRSGLKAKKLVLWEPVASGADYLRELRDQDRLRQTLNLHFDLILKQRDELLGYELPASLAQALQSLDACAGAPPKVEQVVMVSGARTDAIDRLERALTAQNVAVRFEAAAEAGSDGPTQRGTKALLSNEALAAIAQQWGEGAQS